MDSGQGGILRRYKYLKMGSSQISVFVIVYYPHSSMIA